MPKTFQVNIQGFRKGFRLEFEKNEGYPLHREKKKISRNIEFEKKNDISTHL